MGIVRGRHFGKVSNTNLLGMWFLSTPKRLFLGEGKLNTQSQWSHYRTHCSDMIDKQITPNTAVFIGSFTGFSPKMASKP